MTEQTHAFQNWAKERIDEMDAALASLEPKAKQAQAEAKAKADQLVSDLNQRRDQFRSKVEELARAGESALQASKAQLETQWNGFESQIKTYFETVGHQMEQQQATFRDVAAAQAKAWRETVDSIHEEVKKRAAAGRSDVDAVLKQMKSNAEQAEARLQKLKQAGGESWGALSAALSESRKAFDRANQEAWDALRRAAPPHA
ncbi:MAG: hypothetical protein ACR650_12795 [Methylocystis sp.]